MTVTFRPIICIIDHDRDVRGILRAQLAAGFVAVEASDGQEGIQVIRQSGAALAIVDVVSAPIAELRRKFPTLPIIAISGSHQRYLEVARELGANDILARPFLEGELLKRVQNLLNA